MVLTAPEGYHLGRTLSGLRMGRYDPSIQLADSAATLAYRTPDGPASLGVEHAGDALRLRGEGPGGDWLVVHAEALLGLRDEPSRFVPDETVVRRLHRRYGGVHLPRLPVLFSRLVQVVLLQLVSTREALGSWRRLVQTLGEDAPGHAGLRLPPGPAAILETPEFELVALGVRPRQARTLRRVARHATRIEAAGQEGPHALGALLDAIPGVGPWTVQYMLGSALGFADAVLVGDYNLPNTVAYVLAGEARADDARMLELLEPFRGHRFRVIRLLWIHGVHAPRRGPRA